LKAFSFVFASMAKFIASFLVIVWSKAILLRDLMVDLTYGLLVLVGGNFGVMFDADR
jgi:hypothetical protein